MLVNRALCLRVPNMATLESIVVKLNKSLINACMNTFASSGLMIVWAYTDSDANHFSAFLRISSKVYADLWCVMHGLKELSRCLDCGGDSWQVLIVG